MPTVKRLYLYGMSGITLGIFAAGLQLLLDALLGQIGFGRGGFVSGAADLDRQQLSLAAALVGVGLPVWAIHWFLVGRAMRPDGSGAEAERRSPIRAFYLAVVMAIAAFGGALAGSDLVREGIGVASGIRVPTWYGGDLAGAAAGLIVGALVWTFHAMVRRSDVRAGPLTGAAAWWPRVYIYLAAFVGLAVAADAVGSLISTATDPTLFVDHGSDLSGEDARAFQVVDVSARLVVWASFWGAHWWLAARSMRDAGWRGSSERQARLRVVYFVAVIVTAVVQVIRHIGDAIGAPIPTLLGVSPGFGGSLEGEALAQAILARVGAAIPWALAWWFHRRRLLAEAGAVEPGRGRASPWAARLDLHAASVSGLAFAGVGIGWLVGLAIDVAFGGDRTIGEGWKSEIAVYFPFAILGFVVWAWNWSQLRRLRATEPDVEAPSTTRRLAILLVFGVGLVASIGSLAVVLYRTFAAALGVALPGDPVSELSTPVGALMVAFTIALYHGLVVRGDLRLAASLRTDQAAAGSAAAAEVPAMSAARMLVLRGPTESDLDATVAALRADLPPGFDLEERTW